MKWTAALILAAGMMPVSAADDRVVIDNELVRVLNVANAPGQKSALHKHDINRVMIYLDAGHMRLTDDKGKARDVRFKAGDVRWDPAGGLHTSHNVGGKSFRIVEVELKQPKGDPVVYPALDPVKVDPKHYKVEIDNDQVRVVRARYGGHEPGPMHEHGLRRVLVPLTDQSVRLTLPDGKTQDLKNTAYNVTFGGLSKHSEVNLSDQAFEVLLVELKKK